MVAPLFDQPSVKVWRDHGGGNMEPNNDFCSNRLHGCTSIRRIPLVAASAAVSFVSRGK